MHVRSKAPLRVSFCGGGTDMPPYCTEHTGAVFSTAIGKYVHVSVCETGGTEIILDACDLGKQVRWPVGVFEYGDDFDLERAVIEEFGYTRGCHIIIHSDLPAGSGMGTSSALTVALIAAFGQLLGRPLTKHEIAEMACFIERRKLGLAGGYQDQYASACGGFNYIEFGEGVTVFPQQYPRAVCNELLERLVLCYTGKTHVSAEQQQALLSNARALEFMEGMHLLKELAEKARDFLTRAIPGRLDGFGQLLHEGWLVKRGLSQRITTDAIDHLYAHALAHGALGGKLLGAGGGGFLLLFAEATARCRLVEALRVAGGEIVDFLFDASGVEAWVVSNGND